MDHTLTTATVSPLPFKAVSFRGLGGGPRAIILGAVHGNEVCGTQAIQRVISDIEDQRLRIVSGTVTFVPITNPLAYAKADRVGDRNLNRNLAPTDTPREFEDHIANWLCPLLAQHDVLLDLHSTRAMNPPFAMLGPNNNTGPLEPFTHFERERALAMRLGVHRFVDGWLSTYAKGVERRVRALAESGVESADATRTIDTDPRYGIGTTEYMRSTGGYAITLECGQHDDPESPEVGYRAIRNVLAFLGISDELPPQPVTGIEQLHMYEVIDRKHPDDRFSRDWASFDPLTKGTLIGNRHDGIPVIAQEDGFILFPDAKALPQREWFYLARRQIGA